MEQYTTDKWASDEEIIDAYFNLIEEADVRELNLNDLTREIHLAHKKWWEDPYTGEPITRNKGELIALMHSELSECLEGERKDLMDDKLPHRKMAEVEMADVFIRLADYCGGFGYDLDGAVREKLIYNSSRQDHTHEARVKEGGKKF